MDHKARDSLSRHYLALLVANEQYQETFTRKIRSGVIVFLSESTLNCNKVPRRPLHLGTVYEIGCQLLFDMCLTLELDSNPFWTRSAVPSIIEHTSDIDISSPHPLVSDACQNSSGTEENRSRLAPPA